MPDDLNPQPDPVVEPVVTETDSTSLEGGETGVVDNAPVDPFAEYGGADAVRQAAELHKSLQTEDGVWDMFFQAGRALGLGVREIEALFNAQQAEPDAAGPADDDVMTYGQFKAMMEETVTKPQQVRDQQMAEAMARQSIDSTINALGVQDQGIRDAILQLGDRYLSDDISPAAVKKAVEQGHADYLKLVAAERAKYVSDKREQGAGVPKAPAGGSTAPATADGQFGEEPKDITEAIKRARQRIASWPD